MSLELILADGSVYPQKVELAFADRQVDVQTGTIRVAALSPNPGNLLRPGQFGKIRVMTELKKGALLIPQRAVAGVQGRYMGAVIGPENKADIGTVKVAEQIGSDRIISEGLKPGERVVADEEAEDRFTVAVDVAGSCWGEGSGRSKRIAELAAADAALEKARVHDAQ